MMTKQFFEIAREVYNKLYDNESKNIFINRFLFNISSDSVYIDNIAPEIKGEYSYVCVFESIDEHLPVLKNNAPILYSGGYWGKIIYRYLASKGVEPMMFWDKSIVLQKEGVTGKPCCPPPVSFDNVCNPVVIATQKHSDEIEKYLVDNGLNPSLIVKPVFLPFQIGDVYFEPDIIKFESEEVFIDGGCFGFETSLRFLEKCPTANKIYAFECDKRRFDTINKNIEQCEMDNVVFVEKGLWSSTQELKFNVSQASEISGMISDEGIETIQVTSIDESVDGRVTFIKLDVEGAELEALKGAEVTIKSNRPKLAICIYHKPEDIVELPAYILSLIPDYKLYLRHYSPTKYDTVLYAV